MKGEAVDKDRSVVTFAGERANTISIASTIVFADEAVAASGNPVLFMEQVRKELVKQVWEHVATIVIEHGSACVIRFDQVVMEAIKNTGNTRATVTAYVLNVEQVKDSDDEQAVLSAGFVDEGTVMEREVVVDKSKKEKPFDSVWVAPKGERPN